MSLSAQLWQANFDLAQACLNHSFVQGIGDGTLIAPRFAYYVGQDAFFLEAFARAYSIAAAKAPTWDTFQIFHNLAQGALEELNLHETYARQWQVDLRTVAPDGATRQYTDFLLNTAWSQPVAVTAVAMAPCMRLYAYLGQSLAVNGIPDHAYGPWVATYSGSEFAPLVAQLEALVDDHATVSPETDAAYHYAMICELNFFTAAWDAA